MKLPQDTPVTLHSAIHTWLTLKEGQAQALHDKFRWIRETGDNLHVMNQKRYARNLLSAIRWLRSQIPLAFRDILIANDHCVAGIVELAVANLGESESWQSSNQSPTCSGLGAVTSPNNLSEEPQQP